MATRKRVGFWAAYGVGFGLAVAFVIGLFTWWVFFGARLLATYNAGGTPPDLVAALGQTGDLFGALSSLFAAAAFIGVVVTALFQRQSIEILEDQLEAANTATQRQLRAYLQVQTGDWRGLIDGHRFGARVTYHNRGATPAKNVQLVGRIDIAPWPLPSHHVFPQATPALEQSGLAFPGAEPAWGWLESETPISDDNFETMLTVGSDRRAYLHGRVKYVDVFGDQRFTSFQFFLDPLSVQRNSKHQVKSFVWAVHSSGNDFN